MGQSPFDKSYYYGGVYKDYDSYIDWKDLAKQLARDYQFDSFLDVGCGCGNLVKEMRKLGKKAMGVDISEYAVEKAGVEFVKKEDCRKMSFKNGPFDLVYILGTFSYLDDETAVRKAMEEAWRVAKKMIVFEDIYGWPKKGSESDDPLRKMVFGKNKWKKMWKKVVGEKTKIWENGEEIVIERKRLI